MQLRISTPASQAIYVVVALAATVILSILIGTLSGSVTLGIIAETILAITAVVVAARVFRSANEPADTPREWWRMTYSPVSAWIWSVLFAVGGIANLATGGIGVFVGIVGLIIAAAYAQSALRTRS